MKKSATDLAKVNNFSEDLESFITFDLEEDLLTPASTKSWDDSIKEYFSDEANYDEIENNIKLTAVGLAIGANILKEGLFKIYWDYINYIPTNHTPEVMSMEQAKADRTVTQKYSPSSEIPLYVLDWIDDDKSNRDWVQLTFVVTFEDIMQGNWSQAKLVEIKLHRSKRRNAEKCNEFTKNLNKYDSIGNLYRTVLEEFIKWKEEGD